MKILLILCLSFSVFATHHEKKAEDFNEHKKEMLEKLKSAETPNQEDIACVEKAENKKALKKCKKAMKSREKKKTEVEKPKASVPETNQNQEERAEEPAQTSRKGPRNELFSALRELHFQQVAKFFFKKIATRKLKKGVDSYILNNLEDTL